MAALSVMTSLEGRIIVGTLSQRVQVTDHFALPAKIIPRDTFKFDGDVLEGKGGVDNHAATARCRVQGILICH